MIPAAVIMVTTIRVIATAAADMTEKTRFS
jgi:hypothetical protein